MLMKKFISVQDVVVKENTTLSNAIDDLIHEALAYKANPFLHKHKGIGKRIGLIFLNPSLRTRLSTQVAATNLGVEAIVFNVDKEGWAMEFEDGAIMNGHTVEHIKDAAPILGNYFNALCIRAFPALKNKVDDDSEEILNAFVKYAGVPIISLESATLHPLQSLTDILTIYETLNEKQKNYKPKIVLTWAPHIRALPQCVPNSFAQWATAWDKANIVITHPPHYQLNEKYTKGATITHNQNEALDGADIVYVKNWSTYHDYGKIRCTDSNWMLTKQKLASTNMAKVMHCLPVRRNIELSDEVLDSSHSIVTQQAANRVWAAQAVLSNILNIC
jgi:N-succinyl-L-ornithine transcarbamylase